MSNYYDHEIACPKCNHTPIMACDSYNHVYVYYCEKCTHESQDYEDFPKTEDYLDIMEAK